MQPDEFHIARSLMMAATPDKIFAQVNDLHLWHDWSPWAKLDPNSKVTFTGAPAGVGAVMGWDGNAKIGKGSMTITDSQPNSMIRMRLDFERPMHTTNMAEFTFTPAGNQTTVTCSTSGRNSFIAKIMVLLLNCKKMMNAQFDKGLANLKAVVEAK
jgi:hypothetical protein